MQSSEFTVKIVNWNIIAEKTRTKVQKVELMIQNKPNESLVLNELSLSVPSLKWVKWEYTGHIKILTQQRRTPGTGCCPVMGMWPP